MKIGSMGLLVTAMVALQANPALSDGSGETSAALVTCEFPSLGCLFAVGTTEVLAMADPQTQSSVLCASVEGSFGGMGPEPLPPEAPQSGDGYGLLIACAQADESGVVLTDAAFQYGTLGGQFMQSDGAGSMVLGESGSRASHSLVLLAGTAAETQVTIAGASDGDPDTPDDCVAILLTAPTGDSVAFAPFDCVP